MKKIFALFAVAATALPLATTRTEAQNIQIHYDIGREAVTSTVEMFRPDGGGSTFFFIDFDYTPKACGAYSRYPAKSASGRNPDSTGFLHISNITAGSARQQDPSTMPGSQERHTQVIRKISPRHGR